MKSFILKKGTVVNWDGGVDYVVIEDTEININNNQFKVKCFFKSRTGKLVEVGAAYNMVWELCGIKCTIISKPKAVDYTKIP